jgi:hypothetical protein
MRFFFSAGSLRRCLLALTAALCLAGNPALGAAPQPNIVIILADDLGYGQPKPDAHDPPLLFDLNVDPGETFNVAANHPGVVAGLLKEIETHRVTVTPVKSQLDDVRPLDEPVKSAGRNDEPRLRNGNRGARPPRAP